MPLELSLVFQLLLFDKDVAYFTRVSLKLEPFSLSKKNINT